MKLAIMKIGANITFSDNNASAANADILYFLRQLLTKGIEVTIITHKTRNTVIPKRLKFLEIQDRPDLNQFDATLVFNGSINFFGGKEDPNIIALYRMLHLTKRRIIYVNTDGALPFKRLWPSIKNREWAQGYNAEEFSIDPSKVRYLTQGRDFSKLNKLIRSKLDYIQVPKEHFVWYPLYETILAKHEKFIKPNEIPYSKRIFQLGFGGYVRNTHKRKLIEKYYFSDKKTLLFGNLRGVNAGGKHNTHIEQKTNYKHFIHQMSNCLATVIIGDEYYNDNFFTLRMYESLLADNVIYIDEQFDPKHLFFGSPKRFDFLYINNVEDIRDIVRDYFAFKDIRQSILSAYSETEAREHLIEDIQTCAHQ